MSVFVLYNISVGYPFKIIIFLSKIAFIEKTKI